MDTATITIVGRTAEVKNSRPHRLPYFFSGGVDDGHRLDGRSDGKECSRNCGCSCGRPY
jgi:hypothetical protein